MKLKLIFQKLKKKIIKKKIKMKLKLIFQKLKKKIIEKKNKNDMDLEDYEEDENMEEDKENEEDDEMSEEEEEKVKKGIEKEVNTKRQNYLLSIEVMSHIEKLFLNDSGLVSLLFGNMKYDPSTEYKISITTSGTNMFFIRELIVPPNRFRPENASFGGDENYYHYQTSAYRKILALDNDIKELSKKVNENKDNKLKEDDEMIKNKNEQNENESEKELSRRSKKLQMV